MTERVPKFLRVRNERGDLLIEPLKLARLPAPGEQFGFAGQRYTLSDAPLPEPAEERVDVGGVGVVGLVYTAVAVQVAPLPKETKVTKKKSGSAKTKVPPIKVSTPDGEPVEVPSVQDVVIVDESDESRPTPPGAWDPAWGGERRTDDPLRPAMTAVIPVPGGPGQTGTDAGPEAESQADANAATPLTPIETEAKAGYSIRWGVWNRGLCPATGEQLGQPERWCVYQGMSALSDAGANQVAPVLAGMVSRLNAEPGEPSAFEKERGIVSAAAMACVSNDFLHEGDWYQVGRRGAYEIAVGVRSLGTEKHVPPEAGEDLAPRLGRVLDEFYGRARARRPQAVPPQPSPEELASRARSEAEQRAVALLSRAFHGNAARARLLLEGLRASGLTFNWDTAGADAARA